MTDGGVAASRGLFRCTMTLERWREVRFVVGEKAATVGVYGSRGAAGSPSSWRCDMESINGVSIRISNQIIVGHVISNKISDCRSGSTGPRRATRKEMYYRKLPCTDDAAETIRSKWSFRAKTLCGEK